MKRLIAWNMVTLDGFFSAPDGNLDWFVFDDELDKYIRETQPQADTLVFGRVTYQMMASYWPTAEGDTATFMNGAPKYVFSRTLDKVDWTNSILVKGDAVAEVAKLKQQPGKDIYVFGSADFSATLQRHGLIDEYRIGVNPVILGKGIPLFKESEARLKLELIHSRTLKSGVVIMHYEPA
jgi:dihydrofolate reductase